MAKKIPLQNGMYAIVDDEDYERCVEYNWYIHSDKDKRIETTYKNKKIFLDTFIMGNKVEGESYFHKNHNELDYRKENLILTKTEQRFYVSKASRSNKSGYKGVSFDKQRNKWVAQIMVNRKALYLGRFDNKDDAALAYNKAAKEYFGELAYQNVIGLDNRRTEIKGNNKVNRTTKRKSGKYRGVRKKKNPHSDNYHWESVLNHEGKRLYLGYFNINEKEEAAKAYDKKAYELYGDKAILNFPELVEEYKKEVGTNQHQKCTK